MNKPIIFIGPSISKERAEEILEADYRGPAKKGDFLKLLSKDQRTIVGLIDGVFLQDYPPTPIEVYQIVSRKNMFTVYGSSSIGALRAVELEKFGMIGVGKVFELFKNGKLNADDEVAVTFDDTHNRILSEALIDIRYNLFLAEKKSKIDSTLKKELLKISKSLYFPYRNYETIIEIAYDKLKDLHKEINSFQNFIKTSRKSIKEKDAIKLLTMIKNSYF